MLVKILIRIALLLLCVMICADSFIKGNWIAFSCSVIATFGVFFVSILGV